MVSVQQVHHFHVYNQFPAAPVVSVIPDTHHAIMSWAGSSEGYLWQGLEGSASE